MARRRHYISSRATFTRLCFSFKGVNAFSNLNRASYPLIVNSTDSNKWITQSWITSRRWIFIDKKKKKIRGNKLLFEILPPISSELLLYHKFSNDGTWTIFQISRHTLLNFKLNKTRRCEIFLDNGKNINLWEGKKREPWEISIGVSRFRVTAGTGIYFVSKTSFHRWSRN